MILVIGATGNVGREVVKILVAAGLKTRVLTRFPECASSLFATAVEIFAGDLDDLEGLIATMRGVTRLFLASATDLRQVELQRNAIKAAQQAGVQRIVKLSTLGARQNHALLLGLMHYQTEKQIEASGIAFTHLRPHNFMQNTLLFARTISAEDAFYAPLGNARVSLVDVRDIAAVAAIALTEAGHEGKIYNITGAEALSYHQVAAQISAALGREITYVKVREEEARSRMLQSGTPAWLAEDLIRLYRQFRQGGGELVTETVLKVTKRPPISFARFLQDYLPVFKGDLSAVPSGVL